MKFGTYAKKLRISLILANMWVLAYKLSEAENVMSVAVSCM